MFTDSDISHDKLFTTRYFSGAMGAQHMVLNEEQVAFSDWINNNLSKDKDVGHLLLLNVRPVVKTQVSKKWPVAGDRVRPVWEDGWWDSALQDDQPCCSGYYWWESDQQGTETVNIQGDLVV